MSNIRESIAIAFPYGAQTKPRSHWIDDEVEAYHDLKDIVAD